MPAAACLDAVRSAPDYARLTAVVMAQAREIAQADGATFVLRDGEHCFYVDEDAIAPLWRGQRFPIEQCISGWAMRHGEPAFVPRPFEDPRIPHDAYRPTFIRSLVMIPMGDAPALGAIGVYWARPERTLDDGALHQLIELGAEVGRTVERLGVQSAPWAPNFAIGATTPPAANS